MSTYSIAEFAGLTGLSVKTLQRWDRLGKLIPSRTPTNRRMYTDDHLAMVRGSRSKVERKTVAYLRVSSHGQRPDLRNQRKHLEEFCVAKGIPISEWVEEIGGGLNFKRVKFLKIVDGVVSGQVERIVIAHKDRLVRFGYDLILHLCRQNNCEVVVMNTESLSPEQEMVQDLMTITHCFSARLYGLRNYKKALQKALKDDTEND